MMAIAKPAVLFVHGSWHTPVHFAPVREVFERAGYETACPRFASVGNAPPVGLKEDAQVVRDELKRLVNREGKDVLVIAHSYGGVVTSEGVDADFAKAQRMGKGLPGGVVRIVFMCAFVVPSGKSLDNLFGGLLPPWIKVDEATQTCIPVAAHAADCFYNDCTPEEKDRWIGYLLPVPVKTQYTTVTQAAYLFHPSTYLYCTQDQALPYMMQQMMVENATKAGVKMDTVSCDGGHSPYLSMPAKVLEIVSALPIACQ